MDRLHALPLRRGSAGHGDAGAQAGAALSRWQQPGSTRDIALWLFIGVATALFSLFIAAYLMRMGQSDATAILMPWQLWLSSAWLLAGSVLLQRASALTHDPDALRWPLLAGGACALAFIVVQWWAWQEMLARQVSLQGNPAGSFFYLLTTMHALHVLGGLGGWGVALHAGMQRPFDPVDVGWRVALCARYWHFLLAVWLVLFGAFSFITPELAALICGTGGAT